MRIGYRIRQFWGALRARPSAEDLEQARNLLSTAQMTLFTRLQASEQVHGLSVYRKLTEQSECHPDLLVAALLHDVGKSVCQLRPWERALIVLGKAIDPERVKRWGRQACPQPGRLTGWRRPFIVSEQHAGWGAGLAREAGVSPLTERLIRRHQDPVPPGSNSTEDRLLSKLQALDDEN